MKLNERIEMMMKSSGERQDIFIISKDGWMINKGQLKGRLIKDLKKMDGFSDFIDNILDSGECGFKCKLVIKEIMKDDEKN
jgi:hypothetical protein